MGFCPVKSDHGAATPWEYLPGAAGTYKVGQMLKVTDGKVAALGAASTTTPPYVCMAEKTFADGDIIPVVRVNDNLIFETKLAAEAAEAKAGSKLQVAADGLTASGDAAGTFEVVWIEGTAAGSVVRGRFV